MDYIRKAKILHNLLNPGVQATIRKTCVNSGFHHPRTIGDAFSSNGLVRIASENR
jgi:hypothetical protein